MDATDFRRQVKAVVITEGMPWPQFGHSAMALGVYSRLLWELLFPSTTEKIFDRINQPVVNSVHSIDKSKCKMWCVFASKSKIVCVFFSKETA